MQSAQVGTETAAASALTVDGRGLLPVNEPHDVRLGILSAIDMSPIAQEK